MKEKIIPTGMSSVDIVRLQKLSSWLKSESLVPRFSEHRVSNHRMSGYLDLVVQGKTDEDRWEVVELKTGYRNLFRRSDRDSVTQREEHRRQVALGCLLYNMDSDVDKRLSASWIFYTDAAPGPIRVPATDWKKYAHLLK